MRKETFYFLYEEIKHYLTTKEFYVTDPIELDHKLAIAVYWLASSAEFRTIANLFGVSKSTVHKCVHEICNVIPENLLEKYVKFPKDEDLKFVISGFEQTWGFPNCAGALDGTHIPVIAPTTAHGDYLNRKGYYSIILQALCDHQYIIRDVIVGWPGRVHNARVFGSSIVYYKGETNDLFPSCPKPLQLQHKQVFMPVKPWLMKPYTHIANMSISQKTFNYRLSRARMTIENTFGRLKGRWRLLLKRMDVGVDFASNVVTTCVILHNLCEMHRETYIGNEVEDVDNTEDEENDDDAQEDDLTCAKQPRDDISVYFTVF
ncbi:uncharacterized protein [Haliotis cracherodii]|uniref:uncharacterized protein n=1 Tax=Haliotis cracherodii TaxID=6455 RepID=UPI0039ECE916